MEGGYGGGGGVPTLKGYIGGENPHLVYIKDLLGGGCLKWSLIGLCKNGDITKLIY